MLHRLFYSPSKSLVLLCITLSFIVWLSHATTAYSSQSPILSVDELPLLLDGDIVVRKGRSLYSDMFSQLGKGSGRYSHIGVIYRENDQLQVIHTEGDDITGIGYARSDRLQHFTASEVAERFAIYRISGLTAPELSRVIEAGLEHVKSKTPFDLEFRLDNEAQYCSELIFNLFQSVKPGVVGKVERVSVELLSKTIIKDAITVNGLLNSKNIQLVWRSKEQ